jgi:hypothetical protein
MDVSERMLIRPFDMSSLCFPGFATTLFNHTKGVTLTNVQQWRSSCPSHLHRTTVLCVNDCSYEMFSIAASRKCVTQAVTNK